MFTLSDWLTVLGICVGILVSIISYLLLNRRTISARDEREKRAYEELLDAVENLIDEFATHSY